VLSDGVEVPFAPTVNVKGSGATLVPGTDGDGAPTLELEFEGGGLEIVFGANLTNANETLLLSGGNRRMLATTMTANRAKTLSVSGATYGAELRIRNENTTGFALSVINAGFEAGTWVLANLRDSVFRYDGDGPGGNWSLVRVETY
jgi:hypothetical protein